MDAMELGF